LPTLINVDHVEVTVEPWSWPFATARRADIDAHFADLRRRQTALWNGRALMLHSYAVDNGMLTATAYASLCAWRDWGFADPTVLNFFAPAALRAIDEAYVPPPAPVKSRSRVAHLSPRTLAAGRSIYRGTFGERLRKRPS
jgi:hypothetical protein